MHIMVNFVHIIAQYLLIVWNTVYDMFMKKNYAHRGFIYLIKHTIKTAVLCIMKYCYSLQAVTFLHFNIYVICIYKPFL